MVQIAATTGLHFTDEIVLKNSLKAKKYYKDFCNALHVGAGTF